MAFFNFSSVVSAGVSSLSEISLVEEQINLVIRQIELAQEQLQPESFASGSVIDAPAFGPTDSAPNLALHYSKAHEVTWKTLLGVKKDLLDFQQSLHDAKRDIIAADDGVADRARVITMALDEVAHSSHGQQSQQAREDAQQETTNGEDL